MSMRIAAVSRHPDLARCAAEWRVNAFSDELDGTTVEAMTAAILAQAGGPDETFVVFDGERPVGTAGLVQNDMDSRPDLTPWLAFVYVEPAFRGRGYAAALVRRVEDAAHETSVGVLWLYTRDAEGLYSRLGWQPAGLERVHGRVVTLMRRDLAG